MGEVIFNEHLVLCFSLCDAHVLDVTSLIDIHVLPICARLCTLSVNPCLGWVCLCQVNANVMAHQSDVSRSIRPCDHMQFSPCGYMISQNTVLSRKNQKVLDTNIGLPKPQLSLTCPYNGVPHG